MSGSLTGWAKATTGRKADSVNNIISRRGVFICFSEFEGDFDGGADGRQGVGIDFPNLIVFVADARIVDHGVDVVDDGDDGAVALGDVSSFYHARSVVSPISGCGICFGLKIAQRV